MRLTKGFSWEIEKEIKMKNKKEIFSSCCAFGGGYEEVHVLRVECPIDRKLGQRTVQFGEKTREECTCIYSNIFDSGISKCEHYQGIKKVKRNKQDEYKVLCSKIY